MRRLLPLALLLVSTHASAASADDKTTCIAAANEGQDLKLDGKLLAAREKLLVCAAPVCPQLVASDCTKWLEDLDKRIPSIVVVAKSGEIDVAKGVVLVDEKEHPLDAKPIQLDPGTHAIEVRADGKSQRQTIVLAEGERGRIVTLRFTEPPPPPPPAPSPPTDRPSRIPTLTWVAGGIGLLGLASFTYFGLSGRSDLESIRASGCAPHCDPTAVDAGKRKLLVADVSLGIGLVGLAVATIAWVRVDVSPTPGGAYASIAAVF